MDINEMQNFVEESIPLVKQAGFVIRELDDSEVVVEGDRRLNYNHHNTVFGGSISTILILASWLMVRRLLEYHNPEVSIVIERHFTDYLLPVDGNFVARCRRPAESEIKALEHELANRGRGRLELPAFLFQEGSSRAAASFAGTFYCRV
ncbi:YiiD C-terminal domain-containing protein [Marispirochaeta sp.]|uniref:YiiD C-terminal domain-containing protein n=1 Tax=Marispirochaeta sp. TaxID=2038653 RepID=UPI0029C7FA68|nr:YiiD C-terminal domain-containing protein [Marispirochaeta sp.]